ncbi:hypothetical protein CEXT_537681 [Caerostris extrusa]|uniref:Uncharacterized protein n=1 Tax=Caerostris extrusa TaxID=172846 RepID=A0AAV4UEA2_CAEEX|nr:hypothetical protein CEXT_537681 [Caerostris extrusa]
MAKLAAEAIRWPPWEAIRFPNFVVETGVLSEAAFVDCKAIKSLEKDRLFSFVFLRREIISERKKEILNTQGMEMSRQSNHCCYIVTVTGQRQNTTVIWFLTGLVSDGVYQG